MILDYNNYNTYVIINDLEITVFHYIEYLSIFTSLKDYFKDEDKYGICFGFVMTMC